MMKNREKFVKIRQNSTKMRKKDAKSSTFETFFDTTCVSVRAGFKELFNRGKDGRRDEERGMMEVRQKKI